MSDTSILYSGSKLTDTGEVAIGNTTVKFRDEFGGSSIDSTNWVESWTNQGNGTSSFGGNSSGSSYLKVNLDPFKGDTQYTLTSVQTFKMPIRLGFGMSISQRIVGQEVGVELVGVGASGNIVNNSTVAAKAISGTITVASNIATIDFASAHGYNGGDRLAIFGNTENRLNVGPVVCTIVNSVQITVPCTLANGTYTAGGFVAWVDPLDYASNGVSLLAENATATNMSFVSRTMAKKFRITNATIATTAATQSNASPYTDAWNSSMDTEIIATCEDCMYVSRTLDSITTASGSLRYSQDLPDDNISYKIRIRFKQIPGYSVIAANILTATKTGTTTATFVTDVAHGLQTGQFITAYGMRDITNFPAISTAVACTVIDSVTFTAVCGTATTTNTTGGVVSPFSGSLALPGAISNSIQSIVRTSNILTVTCANATAGMLPGENMAIYGMDGSAATYNGVYKVLRMTGSTYNLESIGADFGSINCGGAVIKMTDLRVHYVRVIDYTRNIVEVNTGRGNIDLARAIPVQGTVIIGSGTVTTVTTVAAVTAANLSSPGFIADIASAALTTTTTTAAVSPTFGTGYVVSVPVTVVSGTNPTLDFTIQESDNTGTDWYNVYDFPRITTTGVYKSPNILLRGNRVRYVQTVGGTTPSFTRAINRLQTSDNIGLFVQSIDRAINLTTLNATTASLIAEGCKNFTMTLTLGTAATPPVMQLEGSDSGLANEWYAIGGTLTGVASNSASITISPNSAKFIRARVQTIGVTIGAGYYISFKGF